MRSGEKIDTALSTHMDAVVWKDWAERHATDMQTLQAAGLWGPENAEWHNVVEHSLIVNAMAVFIAQELVDSNVVADMAVVDQASLLHDVTKRKEREEDVSYDNEHESTLKQDLLTKRGYSEAVINGTLYTGRVEDMFIGDDAQRQDAINDRPLEQLIVGYADARVRNTDIVSLKTARDRNKQKVPQDADVYDLWYDFYSLVEKRLFSLMSLNDRAPADITNDAVTAMIAEYSEN